ncbi:MAG: DNA internalization-related competence protein ComEC/Rec2 [Gemmatimonadetes bacterium]|nr:DNA internalization-related competence protein ComEC/Rec2 [Gemmatimonadota bacterium]
MTPVVKLALAWAAGDVAGLFGLAGTGQAALAGALALLLAGLSGRAAGPLLLGSFALAGAGAGGLHAERAARDCRATLPDGARVTIEGVFDGVVVPETTGWLAAESATVGNRSGPCRGAVRVRIPARAFRDLPVGTHVRVSGRWWAVPAGRWPVPPERRGSLTADTVRTIAATHAHPLLGAKAVGQAELRKRFGNRSDLAEALLLARRESLADDVRERFTEAGLAHMLAISGAHVGIIAAVLLLLTRMAGVGVRIGGLCAAAGTIAYILFLGAPHAAARAGLQAVLVLLMRWTQRPADPLGALAVAALVLLCIDGLAVLDAGFQLSFAGMYGIIAWREPLREHLRQHASWAPCGALATTLAATFATAPIAALHFGTVSAIGPLANLVAGPLIALCIPAIALTLATSLASDALGSHLAGGSRVLLELLDGTARIASEVPFGHGLVSTAAVTGLLVTGLVFVISAHWMRAAPSSRAGSENRRAAGFRMLVRVSCAIAAWCVFPLVAGRGSGWLEIHAIDVGQGDAIAIRSPAGRWLLVDAGPRSDRFDAGRSIVVPFLLRRGVDRLDALILTHPDADHIGGAAAVLERMDVRLVIDPAIATGKDQFVTLLESATARRIPWIAGRAGRVIQLDGITLRFLAPESDSLDGGLDANDYSLVFRLEHGRFNALFTGDAPRSVENRIVADAGSGVHSTLLKIGHHGSRTSTGDSVLAAARPRIALLSVGRHNRYGHPDPDVLARLQRDGVQVLRTDRSGTILVRARADGRLQLATTR